MALAIFAAPRGKHRLGASGGDYNWQSLRPKKGELLCYKLSVAIRPSEAARAKLAAK